MKRLACGLLMFSCGLLTLTTESQAAHRQYPTRHQYYSMYKHLPRGYGAPRYAYRGYEHGFPPPAFLYYGYPHSGDDGGGINGVSRFSQ
ncbi:MAG: hypothetical protein HY288_13025 [Planctomycetia bacterium]|nr:hypothetical protein [Planctomycetia bacterium]